MALSDVWARTLVYFGIAEEEDWDEDGYLTEEELAGGAEQPNVRRLPARRSRQDYDDDWTDPEPEGQRTSILRPRNEPRRVRNLHPVQGPGASRVHLILPRSFNAAQQVADPEESRPYFRRLRELAERHGLRDLSMGTSQDYRVAAEEGATFVRVGAVLWQR